MGPNACYDVTQATESSAFLDPLAAYMKELDWGLYSYDQECGRGQYEFDFGYTNALTMADRFTFLRFMVKKVAEQVGAIASFMPKPFADDFRSGAHFNMSLADVKTGENLFAPSGGQPGKLKRRGLSFTRFSEMCFYGSRRCLYFACSFRHPFERIRLTFIKILVCQRLSALRRVRGLGVLSCVISSTGVNAMCVRTCYS